MQDIKLLLALNLQFFAEGGEGDGEGAGDTGQQGDNGTDWIDTYFEGEKQEKETKKEETQMIPKTRFDKVNEKYNQLSELSKTQQAEYDEMVKQLDETTASTKELKATVKAGTERIETLEGVLTNILTAELENINEEYHDLIPKDKPIEIQLEWLAKAKAKGLFAHQTMEFEIGSLTSPKQQGKGKTTANMSAVQLMTMGYSQ